MFSTYLRRELTGRSRQTLLVAGGLAVAIASVVVVNALSTGVRDAQSDALSSVYGVGTDLTVTGAASGPGEGEAGGPRFEFDEGAGRTEDGTTTLSQSSLLVDPMRGILEASAVSTAASVDGVAEATGALALTNTTFSGQIPDAAQPGGEGRPQPPQGGPDGAGGSAFGIDAFSVFGVEPAASTDVGPLSSAEVSAGRSLDAADAGRHVVLVDATYASANEIAVGDVLAVAGADAEVVGIVASSSADADTAADAYLPLDVAQSLAGVGDVVSAVYVQAASSADIAGVQAALQEALPEATVSSQEDLAGTVSGSLASASALVTDLGTWLSIVVLAVALILAVLLTMSGVSRRTREFGTLKAIGWSDGRVVRQVAGESAMQGALGGALGLVLGLLGIAVVNALSIRVSTAPTGPGGPGAPGGGPASFGGADGSAVADIVLSAPVTPAVVVAAVAIAVAGGVLAGAVGGWRAARLSPAEALRAVR